MGKCVQKEPILTTLNCRQSAHPPTDGNIRIGYRIFKEIPSIPISPDYVAHFFMTSLFILVRDTLPPRNRKLATNVRL